MDRPRTGVASRAALARLGRRRGGLVVAALNWVGWASGVEGLTRIYRAWPPMVPWTALWLAGLASAILLQSGQPSRVRVWAGRGVAMVVCVVALVVLTEYVDGAVAGSGPAVVRRGGARPAIVLAGTP